MKTDKSVFAPFRKASLLSDIACPDGELLDADDLFPDHSSNSGDSPGSEKNNNKESLRIPAIGETIADIPDGFRPIGSHRISADLTNIIIADAVGGLRYLRRESPANGWRQIDVAGTDIPEANDGIPAFNIVATTGPWLVLLPHGGASPLYALWDKGKNDYSTAATMPKMMSPVFFSAPAALSGFCNVAGDYPNTHVSVDCPEEIQTAVRAWLSGEMPADSSFYESSFIELRKEIETRIKEAWTSLLANAAAAGLIILPCHASVALRNPSDHPRRQILAPSAPFLVAGSLNAGNNGEVDNVGIRISEYSFSSSTLRLTIEFSCRPMRLSVTLGDDIRPRFLKSLPDGAALPSLLLSDPYDVIDSTRGLSGLRSISWSDGSRARGWILPCRPAGECRKMMQISGPLSMRWHDNLLWNASTQCIAEAEAGYVNLDMELWKDIAADGGMAFNGRLVLFGEGMLLTSLPGLPISPASIEEFEGGGILALRASFRSLSSGEFGQFPIYAFCDDGIRALSPSGDGFRSVQLICRDVPQEGIMPVATPSGVALFSPRGPMVLEGSKMSLITGFDDFIMEFYPEDTFPDVIGLTWHYSSDCLILSLSDGCHIAYSAGAKRWIKPGLSADSFVEAWPELLSTAGPNLIAIKESILRKEEEENGPTEETTANGSLKEGQNRELISRPIKLGNPMGFKKILSAVLTPDGNIAGPWCLEASNDLRHWHPLARILTRSLPRLRGSAWRFYRLRLPIITTLPTGIHITYSTLSSQSQ